MACNVTTSSNLWNVWNKYLLCQFLQRFCLLVATVLFSNGRLMVLKMSRFLVRNAKSNTSNDNLCGVGYFNNFELFFTSNAFIYEHVSTGQKFAVVKIWVMTQTEWASLRYNGYTLHAVITRTCVIKWYAPKPKMTSFPHIQPYYLDQEIGAHVQVKDNFNVRVWCTCELTFEPLSDNNFALSVHFLQQSK